MLDSVPRISVSTHEPRKLPGFGSGGPDILATNVLEENDQYLFDVTVRCPKAQANLALHSDTQALASADEADRAKYEKYKTKARNINHGFAPLSFEAHGAFGRKTQWLLKHLQTHMRIPRASRTNWSARSPLQYWTQRLSVSLWTATAQAVNTLASMVSKGRAGYFPVNPYS
jgi:hypothetical protein